MHTHDHDHLDLEAEPQGEVDPQKRARWRLEVAAGAIIGAAGFVGWPVYHVLTAYRPLRRIQGADATLGLAATLMISVWLLTSTPQPVPVGPHKVGQAVLKGVALTAAGLALASWTIGRGSIIVIMLDWITFPVVLFGLGLGFAYVGRLHRLLGQRRFANASDLMGLALPLMWAGSQLVAGYPGPTVWGIGAAALAMAALCLLALLFGVAAQRG